MRNICAQCLVVTLCIVLLPMPKAATTPWLTDDYVEYSNSGGEPPFFIPKFFPEQDWIAERSREMQRELRPTTGMMYWTHDAVLKDFRFFLAGIANSAWDIPRRRAYWAAIQSDDCPRAFGLFWDVAASEMPYLDDLRYLPRLVERIRWQLLSPAVVDDLPDEWLAVGDLFDHRYLAACLAFEDSLFYDALIEGWAHEAGAQEILRPFVSYPQLVGALGSIHAARDSNAWHLVHLATQGPDGGYGPAGLLFAQLALTARSIAVPDDVVHMLLLRARQTWPVFDLEKPVPILLDSVERRLLMKTGARNKSGRTLRAAPEAQDRREKQIRTHVEGGARSARPAPETNLDAR